MIYTGLSLMIIHSNSNISHFDKTRKEGQNESAIVQTQLGQLFSLTKYQYTELRIVPLGSGGKSILLK